MVVALGSRQSRGDLGAVSIRDIFFANDFKNVSFLVTRFEGDENTARRGGPRLKHLDAKTTLDPGAAVTPNKQHPLRATCTAPQRVPHE